MTLFPLKEANYSIIRKFLDNQHLILNIEPILNRSFNGKIWVDHLEDPNVVYVWDTRNAHFIFGDVSKNHLKEKFVYFFRNEIISDLKANKKSLSLLYSDTWSKLLSEIKTDLIFEPVKVIRILYKINTLKYPNWRKDIPKGFSIEQLSEEILQKDHLYNLEGLKEELLYMWGDFDHFFNFGFGIIACTDDSIAGWCLGEYFSENKGIKVFGIGIETYQKFQRKGIATLMTSALIELGINKGYKIYWDCAKDNIPSKRTADKLGFNMVTEYEVLHVTFDDFEYHINKGNNFYRNNEFTNAINSYKKAITVKPNENWLYWNVAVYFTKLGDVRKSFEYLYKAVHHGWNDLEFTIESKHFKEFHKTNDWKDFINSVKLKQS